MLCLLRLVSPMGQCGAVHLVVEREAGDATEQREVREVIGARRHRRVWVGLQSAPAVLAPEEPAVRRQQLLRHLRGQRRLSARHATAIGARAARMELHRPR